MITKQNGKDKRTCDALANLTAMPLTDLQFTLPPLGEKGSVTYFSEHDEYVILDYQRLPSGRIGKWKCACIDCHEDEDGERYPTYAEEYFYVGCGQHCKWEHVSEDTYDQLSISETLPAIELSGIFPNTFSVGKEPEKETYVFEWDTDKKRTSIRVSLHDATKLKETFESLGFAQIHRDI